MCCCELVGGIDQSACLLWGLAIILLIHQYGKFKISLAIPNPQHYDQVSL